jgi:hypothetical protein
MNKKKTSYPCRVSNNDFSTVQLLAKLRRCLTKVGPTQNRVAKQPNVSFRSCITLAQSSFVVTSTTQLFLKLGSPEWYKGFRQTKMRNGERVLLAILNLCVGIKIRVAEQSRAAVSTLITKTELYVTIQNFEYLT